MILKRLWKQHPLATLLTLGTLLRIILLFCDYSFDVHSYISWGKYAAEHGFAGLYEKPLGTFFMIGPNYPPIMLYSFTLFYSLYHWIFQLMSYLHFQSHLIPGKVLLFLESPAGAAVFLKMPGMIGDIGLAYGIYKIVEKLSNTSKGLIAASLILFNPAFFYNSSLWGQVDAAPLVFIFAAYYLFAFTKHSFFSLLFFALALLTKQTVIIFLPLFLFAYWQKFGAKILMKNSLILLLFSWALFLPFYQKGNLILFPFVTYVTKILSVSGLPFASNSAFNFWGLMTGFRDIKDMSIFILGITYKVWGYIIVVPLCLAILFHFIIQKVAIEKLIFASFLFSFATFLFLTRMHERHFLQVLPFLAIFAVKDRKIFWVFVLLSLFHFVNLYHSWSSPNISVLHDMFSNMYVAGSIVVVTLTVFARSMRYFYTEDFTGSFLRKK